MPTIDARYLPWLVVAAVVLLAALNVQTALLLMRRQDSSVWVENATWLKEGERATVEVADPGFDTLRNQEESLRSVLNDCTLSGEVVFGGGLAAPNLKIRCLDLSPTKLPTYPPIVTPNAAPALPPNF